MSKRKNKNRRCPALDAYREPAPSDEEGHVSANQPRWVVGRCPFCPPSRSTTAKRYGYGETEGVGSWTWGPLWGPVMVTLCTAHDRHSRLKSLALWASNHAESMAVLRFDAIRLVRLASALGKGPHIDAEELLKLGRGATEDDVRACLRPGSQARLRAVKRPRAKELRKRRWYMATDKQEDGLQRRSRGAQGDKLQKMVSRDDLVMIDRALMLRILDVLAGGTLREEVRRLCALTET